MKTYQEALSKLATQNFKFTKECESEILLLQELVERATPMKVLFTTDCPKCYQQELQDYYKPNYCPKCGQRLER